MRLWIGRFPAALRPPTFTGLSAPAPTVHRQQASLIGPTGHSDDIDREEVAR